VERKFKESFETVTLKPWHTRRAPSVWQYYQHDRSI